MLLLILRSILYNFLPCFYLDRNSLLGKILRINIRSSGKYNNYTIPKDNPFVNDSDSKPEVYAYGFRNPWRCTVDRKRKNNKGILIYP